WGYSDLWFWPPLFWSLSSSSSPIGPVSEGLQLRGIPPGDPVEPKGNPRGGWAGARLVFHLGDRHVPVLCGPPFHGPVRTDSAGRRPALVRNEGEARHAARPNPRQGLTRTAAGKSPSHSASLYR